jgi:hypothetical protein
MDDATANLWNVRIAIAQLFALIGGAAWAYFLFLRQRTLWPALTWDVECESYGLTNVSRIIEVAVVMENRGKVEHRFRRIAIAIRGIRRDDAIFPADKDDPVLRFTTALVEIDNLIPDDASYYFVRPGVRERIARPFAIPMDIQFVQVYAEFEYQQSDYVHSAQRVYEVGTQSQLPPQFVASTPSVLPIEPPAIGTLGGPARR